MVDLAKFKNIFISEVEDQFQKLNENLIVLETNIREGKNDNEQILNELMRASHTIKGSSASMGYTKMAFLSHVMEDVFDGARHGVVNLDAEIIDNVFASIDHLEKALNSIKENDEELDLDEFANKFKEITGVSTVGLGKSITNGKKIVKSTEGEKKVIVKLDIKDDAAKQTIQTTLESTKLDYIKVPVKRLDSLLDMVEELLIDKMRIKQVSEDIPEFREVSDHIELLISGIQYEVMQARLVPVEQAFARFPRMIRDLSQKQRKNIEFKIVGGEIELDRTVVDKLGEPLIHLLRNAVDHGVVDNGIIKLEAIRHNERVLFIVENKGKGIDYDKVKKVAKEKGLTNYGIVDSMTNNELANILFDPNFSTSDTVTEISGRGVGLSVVKKFVESMGGGVVIEDIDEGVRFVMDMPLTLAIINSLLVKVKDAIFAIPFSNIERSVSVKQDDLKLMADHEMAVISGINVPIVRLEEVFKLNEGLLENILAMNNPEKTKAEVKDPDNIPITAEADIADMFDEDDEEYERNKKMTVVLTKKDEELVGLVVDGLINVQEIIVKPFTSILQGIKGFSGSTILGDGRVVLILDIINLLKYIQVK